MVNFGMKFFNRKIKSFLAGHFEDTLNSQNGINHIGWEGAWKYLLVKEWFNISQVYTQVKIYDTVYLKCVHFIVINVCVGRYVKYFSHIKNRNKYNIKNCMTIGRNNTEHIEESLEFRRLPLLASLQFSFRGTKWIFTLQATFNEQGNPAQESLGWMENSLEKTFLHPGRLPWTSLVFHLPLPGFPPSQPQLWVLNS